MCNHKSTNYAIENKEVLTHNSQVVKEHLEKLEVWSEYERKKNNGEATRKIPGCNVSIKGKY